MLIMVINMVITYLLSDTNHEPLKCINLKIMIKTKIIETSKATILVIGGLPEDTDKDSIDNVRNEILYYYTGVSPNHAGEEIKIPSGNWQPLGFLRDIEEDVAKELVQSFQLRIDRVYMNYCTSAFSKNTAKESLHSLVEANCLLKNKYGEIEPDPTDIKLTSIPCTQEWYEESERRANHFNEIWKQWQAEQEKVFTNPIIFIEQ